jgi:hypothetical protein
MMKHFAILVRVRKQAPIPFPALWVRGIFSEAPMIIGKKGK